MTFCQGKGTKNGLIGLMDTVLSSSIEAGVYGKVLNDDKHSLSFYSRISGVNNSPVLVGRQQRAIAKTLSQDESSAFIFFDLVNRES